MKVNPLLMYSFIMKPWILSIVLLLSFLTPTTKAADPTWKAGVARTVITPTKPVWLAGYGSKRVPDGKLHDLWMKALALEAPDGQRAVLITSDFQGVPKSVSDQVFQQLQTRYQLSRARLCSPFPTTTAARAWATTCRTSIRSKQIKWNSSTTIHG